MKDMVSLMDSISTIREEKGTEQVSGLVVVRSVVRKTSPGAYERGEVGDGRELTMTEQHA